jgi:hypothetical protein
MEIEALYSMNEVMYRGLLTIIKVMATIDTFLAVAGFAIYLGRIAWLCFSEA